MSTRIMTFSGSLVDPFDLWPSHVSVEDIAHALGMLCRFNGHTREFYSVAEHSINVSNIVEPQHALWALLHDASEAYLTDVPTPLKRSGAFAVYREVEADVMRSVCIRFGLPIEMPESVKVADEIMCATEARDLMPSGEYAWVFKQAPLETRIFQPLTPDAAKRAFLYRFEELSR